MSKLSKYNLIPANTRCPFHDGCSRVRTSQCLHVGNNTAHDFHCPYAAFLDEYLESTGKAELPEQIKLEPAQSESVQRIYATYADFEKEFETLHAEMNKLVCLYDELCKYGFPSVEAVMREEIQKAVDRLRECVTIPINPNR